MFTSRTSGGQTDKEPANTGSLANDRQHGGDGRTEGEVTSKQAKETSRKIVSQIVLLNFGTTYPLITSVPNYTKPPHFPYFVSSFISL